MCDNIGLWLDRIIDFTAKLAKVCNKRRLWAVYLRSTGRL